MFARQTYMKVQPAKVTELRTIYEKEVVPVVKQQKGFVDAYLMEPVQKGEEFISMTMWESQSDAEKYEKSGAYQQLVTKLKGTFQEPKTTLRSYEVPKTFH